MYKKLTNGHKLNEIRRLVVSSTGKYIIIGVSVYIIELLVIFILQNLKYSSLVAVGSSFWVGLLFSFILQKFITFKDRRVKHRILIPQIITFSILVLFNFGFTLLLVKLLSPRFSAIIIRTIALGITTIWNFYIYRTRIFNMSKTVLFD